MKHSHTTATFHNAETPTIASIPQQMWFKFRYNGVEYVGVKHESCAESSKAHLLTFSKHGWRPLSVNRTLHVDEIFQHADLNLYPNRQD